MIGTSGIPCYAATLTGLGPLSFLAGATSAWTLAPFEAMRAIGATAVYGAVILSFLGGIHWASRRPRTGRTATVAQRRR